MKTEELREQRTQCNKLLEQLEEYEKTRVELRKAQTKAEDFKAELERRSEAERSETFF